MSTIDSADKIETETKQNDTHSGSHPESLEEHGADDVIPAFSIVPIIRTPVINPGDDVEVAIYCTGYGNCTKSKLFVNFLNPSVFRESDIFEMVASYKDIGEDFCVDVRGEDRERVDESKRNTVALLPSSPLMHSDNWTYKRIAACEDDGKDITVEDWVEPPGKGRTSNDPSMYPFLRGERDLLIRKGSTASSGTEEEPSSEQTTSENEAEVEYRPPMVLTFHTKPSSLTSLFSKDRCKPGNYRLEFHLTYGSETEMYQDDATINFHVRNWQERHWRIVVGAGLIAVFIATISLGLQIVPFV